MTFHKELNWPNTLYEGLHGPPTLLAFSTQKNAKNESDPRHNKQLEGGDLGMYSPIRAHIFAFGTIGEC